MHKKSKEMSLVVMKGARLDESLAYLVADGAVNAINVLAGSWHFFLVAGNRPQYVDVVFLTAANSDIRWNGFEAVGVLVASSAIRGVVFRQVVVAPTPTGDDDIIDRTTIAVAGIAAYVSAMLIVVAAAVADVIGDSAVAWPVDHASEAAAVAVIAAAVGRSLSKWRHGYVMYRSIVMIWNAKRKGHG